MSPRRSASAGIVVLTAAATLASGPSASAVKHPSARTPTAGPLGSRPVGPW